MKRVRKDHQNTVDEPIQLISKVDGQFVLHEPALDMIRKVRGEIGVISIVGVYRTGKSYILNRFLGRQSAFKIGPTINACTKGIYIWGRPILIERENKPPLNVILLDTEGLASIEEDETYNTQIFALAIIMSSYFIYNSMGTIDERALDTLSLVANLTKHLCSNTNIDPVGNSNENTLNSNETELAPYFPKFLWLVRDFTLDLLDKNNRPITPTQYLENALEEIDSQSAAKKSKNQIRRSLKSFFLHRDCYTLIRPVVDEKLLKNIENVPENQLRPDFLRATQNLVDRVFNEVEPKRINGRPISGDAFAHMMNIFVQEINNGSIPTIRNTWSAVATIENQKVFKECHEFYLDFVGKRFLPETMLLSDEALSTLNEAAQIETLEYFDKICYSDADEFRKDLIKQLDQEYKTFVKQNEQNTQTATKEYLMKLLQLINSKIQAGGFKDIPNFLDEWNGTIVRPYFDHFKDQAVDLIICHTFIDFYLSNLDQLVIKINAQVQQRFLNEMDSQKAIETKLRQEILLLKEELNTFRVENAQYREQVLNYRSRTTELEENLKEKQGQLFTCQNQLLEAEKRLAISATHVVKLEGDYKLSEQSNETLKLRVKELNLKVSEALKKSDEIEIKYKESQKKYKESEEKYNESQRILGDTQSKCNEIEKKYNELQKIFDGTQRKYNEIEKKYNESLKNFEEIQLKYHEIQKNSIDIKKYEDLRYNLDELQKKYDESYIKLEENRLKYLETQDILKEYQKKCFDYENHPKEIPIGSNKKRNLSKYNQDDINTSESSVIQTQENPIKEFSKIHCNDIQSESNHTQDHSSNMQLEEDQGYYIKNQSNISHGIFDHSENEEFQKIVFNEAKTQDLSEYGDFMDSPNLLGGDQSAFTDDSGSPLLSSSLVEDHEKINGHAYNELKKNKLQKASGVSRELKKTRSKKKIIKDDKRKSGINNRKNNKMKNLKVVEDNEECDSFDQQQVNENSYHQQEQVDENFQNLASNQKKSSQSNSSEKRKKSTNRNSKGGTANKKTFSSSEKLIVDDDSEEDPKIQNRKRQREMDTMELDKPPQKMVRSITDIDRMTKRQIMTILLDSKIPLPNSAKDKKTYVNLYNSNIERIKAYEKKRCES